MVFTARPASDGHSDVLATGAQILQCAGAGGQVDLKAMLHELAQQSVNEVHVEAGAVLNGALLQAGLVDELLLYLAPSMLGQGRPMAQWSALTSLSDRLKLQFTDVQRVGDDLRIRAIVQHPRA